MMTLMSALKVSEKGLGKYPFMKIKTMKLKEMDSESVSISGFYIGIIGTVLSFIGVLLSVFSFSSAEKAVWLGTSGWIAAILCAIALTKLCLHLMEINTEIRNNLIEATNRGTLLSEKNDHLQRTNDKIVEIDAYVISKAVRKPSPRKEQANTAQARPAADEEIENLDGEA